MAVGDELEAAALREDCRLVINGAISEPEEHMGCDSCAMRNLNEISSSENLAILRSQLHKAVKGSL
jgi:hypothetical protein